MTDRQLKSEQESGAERKALPFVYGVNFTDCLRVHGIATELSVNGKVIQAHRIYGAWTAFLRGIGCVTGQVVTTTTKGGESKEKSVVKEPVELVEAEYLMQ